MKRVLKWIVIAILFLLFGGQAYLRGYHNGVNSVNQVASKEYAMDSNRLWDIIQEWRRTEGLPEYTKDERLCEIARKRVPQIKNEIGHPHEGLYRDYSNYPYHLSENGTGAIDERDALQRWLKSASHAAALRYPYKYSCVAVEKHDAVQIFSNF